MSYNPFTDVSVALLFRLLRTPDEQLLRPVHKLFSFGPVDKNRSISFLNGTTSSSIDWKIRGDVIDHFPNLRSNPNPF